MLSCMNVNKSQLRTKLLDAVNLKLEAGNIYGLVGPNGSGKSTLLKAVAGLEKISAGEIKINGEVVGHKTRSFVSFMPSESYLYNWMRVSEIQQFYSAFYKDFDQVYFNRLLDAIEISAQIKVAQLSLGQKTRLKLALTLSRKTSMYLLDEPFKGLDQKGKDILIRELLDSFHSEVLFVIASHQLETMSSLLDAVIFMEKGRIKAFETIEDLNLTSAHSLKSAYKEVFGYAETY
ncbi:ATP-binding cassette domain-containing protein [Fusibacter sp. JL298sf-3]